MCWAGCCVGCVCYDCNRMVLWVVLLLVFLVKKNVCVVVDCCVGCWADCCVGCVGCVM